MYKWNDLMIYNTYINQTYFLSWDEAKGLTLNMKFEIKNLSDEQADCFLILLENDKGDTCSILVDANKKNQKNECLKKIVKELKRIKSLDYILVTHVDDDHLGGILKLLDEEKNIYYKDKLSKTVVIYNCITRGNISYRQAEVFEKLKQTKNVITSYQESYPKQPGMLRFLSIKSRKTKGDWYNKLTADLTFLGPDKKGVNAIVEDYANYKLVQGHGGKPKENSELINRYSITFLLEFAGKRVLFLGDTYLEEVVSKYDDICQTDKKKLTATEELEIKELEEKVQSTIVINLIKIPHHGAKDNNRELGAFAKKYNCKTCILTGKQQWDNKHPHSELIKNLYENSVTKIYTEIDLAQVKTDKDESYPSIQRNEKNILLL